ncbi:MAG: acyl-CoA thioesterase [Desulfotalea sp.]
MRRGYFKKEPGVPSPLTATCLRKVRFQEVDTLEIVWHGHYPSYFEDGRQTLGEKYSMSYLDFYREKVAAPIRKLEIDYLHPLCFGDVCRIETKLHYSEAAKINYEYFLYNQENRLCTTGCSVQMLICGKTKELLLTPPPFLQEFLDKWRANSLTISAVQPKGN